MTTIQIISSISIMILFAVWNGVSINFYNTKDLKWNKYYHYVGFVLRGLLVAMFWGNWLMMLILANLSWTLYDAIIALIIKQPVFYVGKTSWMDKTFGYLIYLPKLLLLLFTIYFIIK